MATVLSVEKTVRNAVDSSLNRITQHPFMQAANKRQLTQNQLERWVMCAGRESRSFPNILNNMLARSSNERIREVLSVNLDDELGNGNIQESHFNHYQQLLDKLGISRERFADYGERAGIKLTLSLAYNISMQGSDAIALGYMIVNEGMTELTYSAVREAIRFYYPGVTISFFDMHVEIDAKHVSAIYSAINTLPEAKLEDLLFGVSVGERGLASLLDEAWGLFDHCPTV